MTDVRSCSDCKKCLKVDYGYSNWTCEGTNVYCLLDLFAEQGFDNFYGDDPRLEKAEDCVNFEEGDCGHLDVDREEYDDLPDEHKTFIQLRDL